MSVSTSDRVHPTAVIDPRAELADDVRVGPYAVIDGPVRIGPGCVIRARATLCGSLTLGRNNDVGIAAVLGERPQHLGFTGDEDTRTEIGDGNIFREFVTINRGTPATGVTVVGSNNFFMANAHVAHDCRVGNHVILANGVVLGGHSEVADRVFFGGCSGLHQFARAGRLAFLSGFSCSTRDIPPFMMYAHRDRCVGVNRVGMRRAGMTTLEIGIVREVHRILFRSALLQRLAVERVERELGHHAVVAEILAFIRSSKRGFVGGHHASASVDAEAA
jgi:UDP-N-acetylglucosamine acyltransferase